MHTSNWGAMTLKAQEILPFVPDLKDIILSEMSQLYKDSSSMITLLCGI